MSEPKFFKGPHTMIQNEMLKALDGLEAVPSDCQKRVTITKNELELICAKAGLGGHTSDRIICLAFGEEPGEGRGGDEA